MTDIQFHFEVMQPMDRPVHRWDTCCRHWSRHAWALQREFLRAVIFEGSWISFRIFLRFLPEALQPIIGTCPWHGLKTGTDA